MKAIAHNHGDITVEVKNLHGNSVITFYFLDGNADRVMEFNKYRREQMPKTGLTNNFTLI